MPYERRYSYRGIEPLWDSVVRILRRDLPEELALLAAEPGATALPALKVYEAASIDLERPFVVVEPDEDDALQDGGGASIAEANQFDILIAAEQRGTDEECVRDLVRYKRAVRNVLWSASNADMTAGITNTPPSWDVRGGRYRWAVWGLGQDNVNGRVVENMKLIVRYEEMVNT